ncbi:MAG: hypothetical protein Q7S19_02910 [bacterium]|nr:hypothetical protein [bacterium]
MEKPYLQKFSEIDGITVWIVDGYYIRQNIDINFNNFGQHYRFNFIPKNEFWLDRQDKPGEENYFIAHLLAEHKLMAEGKDYNDALDEGDKIEQELRGQNKRIRDLKERLKTDRASVLKDVRLKLLKEYTNEIVKTCVVDSFLVRSLFYIDWVAGGHDKVYPAFVPPNEVWLDNDIVKEEMKYVLLHELHERYWMSKGWEYNKAHASALEIEAYCYQNPTELESKIQEELARQV